MSWAPCTGVGLPQSRQLCPSSSAVAVHAGGQQAPLERTGDEGDFERLILTVVVQLPGAISLTKDKPLWEPVERPVEGDSVLSGHQRPANTGAGRLSSRPALRCSAAVYATQCGPLLLVQESFASQCQLHFERLPLLWVVASCNAFQRQLTTSKARSEGSGKVVDQRCFRITWQSACTRIRPAAALPASCSLSCVPTSAADTGRQQAETLDTVPERPGGDHTPRSYWARCAQPQATGVWQRACQLPDSRHVHLMHW